MIGEYLGEGAIAPLVMIRRGNHKFVHSPVDPDQLYDLAEDPDEMRNLAAERAQAPAVRDFRARGGPALGSCRRRGRRDREPAPPPLVDQALRRGRYTPWDYQPLRDASRLYVRNDQDLGDLEAMARFPPVRG